MTIRQFLLSRDRSAWCTEGSIEVYTRKANRALAGAMRKVIDLATFTSESPGSGSLPDLFDRVEAMAGEFGYEGVFVENVLNERLLAWLDRRGYQRVPNPGDPHDLCPCVWRPTCN